MCDDKKIYDSRDYNMDRKMIDQINLTSDEYEKRIKELCERNRF